MAAHLEELARLRARALSELPFVGRTRELRKVLDGAASKIPSLICGLPGMGKTRLLPEPAAVQFSNLLNGCVALGATRTPQNAGSVRPNAIGNEQPQPGGHQTGNNA